MELKELSVIEELSVIHAVGKISSKISINKQKWGHVQRGTNLSIILDIHYQLLYGKQRIS